MSSVEFQNVTKTFSKSPVLENVTLSVKDGEFLVLVGPSGCGKSTLLRILAGLEECTSGDVLMEEKSILNINPKDRNIAMVFQSYALYPHMNVFENMAFGLRMKKTPESEILARVNEASEMLQISHLLDRKPTALSGGQRQRVALGRAIVRKAPVFLFDEPLSNLDAKLRNQMRVEIKRLHQLLKNTMIYVTHDQIEATTMGDRIAVLNQGIVQQVASPAEIYARPINKFVASFIGAPEMNFFDNYLPPEAPAPIKNSHRRIIFGIRPEHITFDKRSPNSTLIQAPYQLEEFQGARRLMYYQFQGKMMAMLTSQPNVLTTGQNASLYLNLDRAHYFDAESGERV